MTQEDYKLWTGKTVTFEDEDWCRIVKVAMTRLASFLCLESFPALNSETDDLRQLLAEFICEVLERAGGDSQVESKSVRNFTIKFRSDDGANAFAQIAKNYGDVIDKYSACESNITIESNRRKCCGCF